jgi:hypothetical protein
MNEPRAGADTPKDLDAPGGHSGVVLWLEAISPPLVAEDDSARIRLLPG